MGNKDDLRIGVYVCHCGSNIAGVIDPKEVAEYASHLPGVVLAKDHRYLCSDPGQDLIIEDIKEHNLNRVIAACCTVTMHEPTFRTCVARAGLNPFLMEMANIREQDTWCHPHYPEEALQKAKEIVAAAVAKARYLTPLETLKVPVTKKALIIGGGIAGISAALDLGDMGIKTYLVEKEPSIGGHMAQLDKTFPTMDCSICIEAPKMVDMSNHPNIEILSYAEVKEVSGYIGNFKVKVEKKPRYIIPERCNGCGLCAEVCPIEVPNEFEEGMGPRKAAYVPMPQAVPMIYTIDIDNCIKCYKCVDACGDLHAIDFSQQPEEIELDVGTIIVATGFDIFDPTPIEEYGFGRYENVLTTLEVERLHCAGGPTAGEFIRPSDGKMPKSLAFIQCVGSRDSRFMEYCSGFCCMYTIKNALLLKWMCPEMDITIFYIDIRATGKGYEEFYQRARDEGIRFVHGRPSQIVEDPETKNLFIYAEDIELGQPVEMEVEMVSLSTAAVARDGATDLARTLTISTGSHGFFLESHPKLKPIDTAIEGIFLAGAAQGPKDIPACVAQGSGTASRAARILSADEWEIEPIVAYVWPDRCINAVKKCEICTTKCPYDGIVAEPGEPARVIPAKCHGCGTCVAECPHNAITQMHFTDAQILAQIHALLAEKPEEKILTFMCHWCSSMGCDNAGTSHFEYPPSSRGIRVMCSGRLDRDFILEAFRLGAGMVLASGCYPQDCHYIDGRRNADKRFQRLAKRLERMGISPDRFRVESISATEGVKYARVITEMDETLRSLGVEKIKAENEKARPKLEKRLERLREVPGVAEVLSAD